MATLLLPDNQKNILSNQKEEYDRPLEAAILNLCRNITYTR